MKTHRAILFAADRRRPSPWRAAGAAPTAARATVLLSVTDFDGLPVSVSLRSPASAAFQIGDVTLTNFFKDPRGHHAAGHQLQGIELRSYEITYRRRDTRQPRAAAGGAGDLRPGAAGRRHIDLINLPFL